MLGATCACCRKHTGALPTVCQLQTLHRRFVLARREAKKLKSADSYTDLDLAVTSTDGSFKS